MTTRTISGSEEGNDPLEQITGDPDAAQLLRRNLTTLAEQERGSAMGELITQVLSGRRSPEDLETDPDFVELRQMSSSLRHVSLRGLYEGLR